MQEEPATEFQVKRLQQLGCTPERPLTREEAAKILHDFEVRSTHSAASRAALLHLEVARLKAEVGVAERSGICSIQETLEQALTHRCTFWADTCREPRTMRESTPETIGLYMKHGCRFSEPTREQVQEVLDALDSALTGWDAEHPELFYQTLELNFRDLVKR